MKVAFGLRSHSGWAALVVLAQSGEAFSVVDRRRIELVDEDWAKQPYHAAEGLERDAAAALVRRGLSAADRVSTRALARELERARRAGHDVAACAVLVGDPLPGWDVHEILAVHFRMHKAEGVMFRDALLNAARSCGVRGLAVHEQTLDEHTALASRIAALGKSVGPPWGKDQKQAALAAALALLPRRRAP